MSSLVDPSLIAGRAQELFQLGEYRDAWFLFQLLIMHMESAPASLWLALAACLSALRRTDEVLSVVEFVLSSGSATRDDRVYAYELALRTLYNSVDCYQEHLQLLCYYATLLSALDANNHLSSFILSEISVLLLADTHYATPSELSQQISDISSTLPISAHDLETRSLHLCCIFSHARNLHLDATTSSEFFSLYDVYRLLLTLLDTLEVHFDSSFPDDILGLLVALKQAVSDYLFFASIQLLGFSSVSPNLSTQTLLSAIGEAVTDNSEFLAKFSPDLQYLVHNILGNDSILLSCYKSTFSSLLIDRLIIQGKIHDKGMRDAVLDTLHVLDYCDTQHLDNSCDIVALSSQIFTRMSAAVLEDEASYAVFSKLPSFLHNISIASLSHARESCASFTWDSNGTSRPPSTFESIPARRFALLCSVFSIYTMWLRDFSFHAWYDDASSESSLLPFKKPEFITVTNHFQDLIHTLMTAAPICSLSSAVCTSKDANDASLDLTDLLFTQLRPVILQSNLEYLFQLAASLEADGFLELSLRFYILLLYIALYSSPDSSIRASDKYIESYILAAVRVMSRLEYPVYYSVAFLFAASRPAGPALFTRPADTDVLFEDSHIAALSPLMLLQLMKLMDPLDNGKTMQLILRYAAGFKTSSRRSRILMGSVQGYIYLSQLAGSANQKGVLKYTLDMAMSGVLYDPFVQGVSAADKKPDKYAHYLMEEFLPKLIDSASKGFWKVSSEVVSQNSFVFLAEDPAIQSLITSISCLFVFTIQSCIYMQCDDIKLNAQPDEKDYSAYVSLLESLLPCFQFSQELYTQAHFLLGTISLFLERKNGIQNFLVSLLTGLSCFRECNGAMVKTPCYDLCPASDVSGMLSHLQNILQTLWDRGLMSKPFDKRTREGVFPFVSVVYLCHMLRLLNRNNDILSLLRIVMHYYPSDRYPILAAYFFDAINRLLPTTTLTASFRLLDEARVNLSSDAAEEHMMHILQFCSESLDVRRDFSGPQYAERILQEYIDKGRKLLDELSSGVYDDSRAQAFLCDVVELSTAVQKKIHEFTNRIRGKCVHDFGTTRQRLKDINLAMQQLSIGCTKSETNNSPGTTNNDVDAAKAAVTHAHLGLPWYARTHKVVCAMMKSHQNTHSIPLSLSTDYNSLDLMFTSNFGVSPTLEAYARAFGCLHFPCDVESVQSKVKQVNEDIAGLARAEGYLATLASLEKALAQIASRIVSLRTKSANNGTSGASSAPSALFRTDVLQQIAMASNFNKQMSTKASNHHTQEDDEVYKHESAYERAERRSRAEVNRDIGFHKPRATMKRVAGGRTKHADTKAQEKRRPITEPSRYAGDDSQDAANASNFHDRSATEQSMSDFDGQGVQAIDEGIGYNAAESESDDIN